MNITTNDEQELSVEAQIEAVLFVSPNALSLKQLAEILDIPLIEAENGMKALIDRYNQNPAFFGLRVQKHYDRYQLTTAPQASSAIDNLLGIEVTTRLTRPALESLAIIAYRQPVTRPQIDAIRGVNSDGVLKTLLGKGLIEEVGRADAPGRPILYCTTSEFLQYFGLNTLEDLPALPE
jgi:segregation and condensation protein B